ncbi:MAG: hypothetical protein JSR98_04180, partial [Proteobacteria bacterium]|nr:hypothetical protein [Pseudomonadota bacterium]
MKLRGLAGIAGALSLVALAGPGARAAGPAYDLVIIGGRVMDPETGA